MRPALVDIPSVVLILECIHLRQQLKETCYAVPATLCLTVTDGLMEEPPCTISVPASQQNLYHDNTSLLYKRCHPVDLLALQWLLPLPASESLTESAQPFAAIKLRLLSSKTRLLLCSCRLRSHCPRSSWPAFNSRPLGAAALKPKSPNPRRCQQPVTPRNHASPNCPSDCGQAADSSVRKHSVQLFGGGGRRAHSESARLGIRREDRWKRVSGLDRRVRGE